MCMMQCLQGIRCATTMTMDATLAHIHGTYYSAVFMSSLFTCFSVERPAELQVCCTRLNTPSSGMSCLDLASLCKLAA